MVKSLYIQDLVANNKRLEKENKYFREVLEKLSKLGNGDRYGNSIGNEIAQDALGIDRRILQSIDAQGNETDG